MLDQIGRHCATLVAESLLIHADAREDTPIFGITWEAILGKTGLQRAASAIEWYVRCEHFKTFQPKVMRSV